MQIAICRRCKKMGIDFEEQEKQASGSLTEITCDELTQKWMKNTKVGEEVTLDIVKMYKDTNVNAKTKEGRTFSTALSSVDFKYTFETKDGSRYSPTSWEVVTKIQQIMKDEKKVEVKIIVKHTRDGNATKDKQENYEVKLA